jgi:hypothetical protein
LAHHKDFFRIALEPAAHDGLLWQIQILYAYETRVFPLFFAHRDQSIVLQRGDEMPILAGDEFGVSGS